MTHNQPPFVDVSNGSFSSGQLILVLRNVGDGPALIHRLVMADESIDLPRITLASGDTTEAKVDLSLKRITRDTIDEPILQLFYKSLDGSELSTKASVRRISRDAGGFSIEKIEGSEPDNLNHGASNDSVAVPAQQEPTYSVALSYASEDQKYVEVVNNTLSANGISVFFDRDADIEIEMWGKNLLGYLQEIFGKGRADYCVIFVSDLYQEKAFTIYELENAVSHSLLDKKKDYIWPVMLQGNKLPAPLTPTTKYIDARDQRVDPETLAQMIITKIQSKEASGALSGDPENTQAKFTSLGKTKDIRLPRVPRAKHDPSSDPDYVFEYLVSELVKRGESLKDSGIDVAVSQRGKEKIVKVKRGDKKIYNLAVWLGGMTNDDEIAFFQWTDRRIGGTNSMHAFGRIEWSQEKNAYVINLTNVSLLKEIGGQHFLVPSELVELLWDNIVEEVENEYERQ